MPLIHSGSDKARGQNIAEMVRSGHPRNQAIAASYSNQRKYRASGGSNTPDFAPGTFPQLTQSQIAAAIPRTALTPAPNRQSSQNLPNRIQTTQKVRPSVPQFNNKPMYGGYASGGRPRRAFGGINVANSSVPAFDPSANAGLSTLPAATGIPPVPVPPQPFGNSVSNVPLSVLSGQDSGNGIVAQVNGQGIPSGMPSAPTIIPNKAFQPSNAGGRKIPQFASGGVPSTPWFVKSEAHDHVHTGGLFGGHAPGRADTLPVDVPVDSHIIPADVVAAIGQGNTLAGGNILTGMFHSLPYGIPSSGSKGTRSLPLPRAPAVPRPLEWKGGRKSSSNDTTVPIAASSGEFNVHPAGVYQKGLETAKNMHLDPRKLTPRKVMDLGHDVIDKFIVHTRKKEIEAAKKRPGPKKD